MIKIDKNTREIFSKIWVFSDPHYSHKNICRATTNWRTKEGDIPFNSTRDFKSLEHMNQTIVQNINNYVMQNDILICLGDWSFGGFENIREFREKIVCKNIHLVLGNHDNHIEKNRDNVQDLFLSVTHYNTLDYNGNKFVLMHYPISSWDGLNKGVMHLHGHCHLQTNLRFGKGRRMDVGLDGHPEFRPYNIDECIKLLKNREVMSDVQNDHHLDGMLNVDNNKSSYILTN
jgi:calcineurin-like phosphoesterase family protein